MVEGGGQEIPGKRGRDEAELTLIISLNLIITYGWSHVRYHEHCQKLWNRLCWPILLAIRHRCPRIFCNFGPVGTTNFGCIIFLMNASMIPIIISEFSGL